MMAWIDLALRSALRSPARSLQLVAVSALASFLACAAAAVANALGDGLGQAGDPNIALILSSNAEGSPERSLLNAQITTILASVKGVAVSPSGTPLTSKEILNHAALSAPGVTPRQALVRGITDQAWALHGQARLTAGTLPGPDELLVGEHAAAALGLSASQVAIGETLAVSGHNLRVSGHFQAPGSPVASELWLPYTTVQALTRRDQPSLVRVAMHSPQLLDDLDYLSLRRSDLEFTVIHEPAYYAALAAVHRPLRLVAYAAAAMALLAAAVGATSTLAAACAARSAELACLRAIGVGPLRCCALLVGEAMVLGLAGALPGLVAALLLLEGASLPLSGGSLPLAVDGRALIVGSIVGLALLPLATLLVALPILTRPLPLDLRGA